MLNLDSCIFEGTFPLNMKVLLLKDNHGVDASVRTKTATSEAFEKTGPMSKEKGIPMVAFRGPTVFMNNDGVIRIYYGVGDISVEVCNSHCDIERCI
jgi:hypothetical protein